MAPGALLLPIPVEIAVGAAFIAAGAAAWRFRPANRMGLLMILAGVPWFGRDLARTGGGTPNRAGELSLNLFLALVAHQVIVFPSGIARSPLGRRLIASGYALAVGGYVVSEIFPSTNDALAALAIPLIALIIFDVIERWLTATPAATPAEGNGRAVLELPGVAALSYDCSLQDDPALVAAAGAAARLALENARLQAELRAQLESRRHAEGDQLRVDFVTAPSQPGALAELTTRELEVLSLLAEGRTDRGIASALYITPKTVEAHVRSIFRKLDLPADATMENRRVHAVLTFLRAR
jgi:DNA-binding CsgD family transcriptional regulator